MDMKCHDMADVNSKQQSEVCGNWMKLALGATSMAWKEGEGKISQVMFSIAELRHIETVEQSCTWQPLDSLRASNRLNQTTSVGLDTVLDEIKSDAVSKDIQSISNTSRRWLQAPGIPGAIIPKRLSS